MATGLSGTQLLLCLGFPAAGLPVSSVWHLLSVVVAPLAAAAFAVGTAAVDTGGVQTLLVDTFGVEETVAFVGTVLVVDKTASWEAALQTM